MVVRDTFQEFFLLHGVFAQNIEPAIAFIRLDNINRIMQDYHSFQS